jgi:fucose permease
MGTLPDGEKRDAARQERVLWWICLVTTCIWLGNIPLLVFAGSGAFLVNLYVIVSVFSGVAQGATVALLWIGVPNLTWKAGSGAMLMGILSGVLVTNTAAMLLHLYWFMVLPVIWGVITCVTLIGARPVRRQEASA